MQDNKLNQIAARQLEYSTRDYAFGALMAIVVAVMLLAFTTTGSIRPQPAPEVEPATYTLADTAADIEAHTAAACGDIEAPQLVVEPALHPAC